jgi:UDP-N-acetylglucosamine diphosphorylase/glucosamine-1-phosphate N-acetyltransferase
MQIILFEDNYWSRFLPLVYTRPVGELRIGMDKLSTKYEALFGVNVFHETRGYLRSLFPVAQKEPSLFINARLIPDPNVVEAIRSLPLNTSLMYDGQHIAYRCTSLNDVNSNITYAEQPVLLNHITDLFALNDRAMQLDFDQKTKGKVSEPLHPSNVVIGDPALMFICKGAKVYASTFNTNEGPIYIDTDAEVMEGSHIRGPFYLGEHASLKMATKVYGPTTIGPHCKVGGEVSNSVIQGYSNKGHDGFLGNSLLGEWCNLGADTNTSNLKNNYSAVRIWNYASNQYTDTGLTFCGLIMGDHSKAGINTMFNTGTVAGVCANVFGGDFPPKHIPSFTWGGAEGFEEYDFAKSMETISRVMARRHLQLTDEIIQMLKEVFDSTAPQRVGATQSQE